MRSCISVSSTLPIVDMGKVWYLTKHNDERTAGRPHYTLPFHSTNVGRGTLTVPRDPSWLEAPWIKVLLALLKQAQEERQM